MPREFGVAEPQRCCAKCAVILEPLQPELQATIAPAMQSNQLKEGEVTGEYRRYTNSPFKFDLASEVRKATYTIQNQLEGLETKIEDHHVKESFLRDAHGLAFITTMQGGCIASVQTGTGLVVTRQGQNSWSAPCAVGTIGVGFGALFGLESTDLMIVLPDEASVNTFISSGQFAIGGEVNLALGPFGRAIKADVRANHKSAAPTISYSNSRGFYGGISLEGSFLKVCRRVVIQDRPLSLTCLVPRFVMTSIAISTAVMRHQKKSFGATSKLHLVRCHFPHTQIHTSFKSHGCSLSHQRRNQCTKPSHRCTVPLMPSQFPEGHRLVISIAGKLRTRRWLRTTPPTITRVRPQSRTTHRRSITTPRPRGRHPQAFRRRWRSDRNKVGHPSYL